jgi:hypothetical protein
MFLEKEYLSEHNRRFTRVPAHPEDYHRPTPRAAELNDAFHLETERVIGNDWVVRHDNRYFQVKQYAALPKAHDQVSSRYPTGLAGSELKLAREAPSQRGNIQVPLRGL